MSDSAVKLRDERQPGRLFYPADYLPDLRGIAADADAAADLAAPVGAGKIELYRVCARKLAVRRGALPLLLDRRVSVEDACDDGAVRPPFFKKEMSSQDSSFVF